MNKALFASYIIESICIITPPYNITIKNTNIDQNTHTPASSKSQYERQQLTFIGHICCVF